jgi:hypothetical protein
MAKNSVANSAETTPKRVRGKPFEPGNSKGFKPGQSGNPSGRPKNEVSLTYWLKEWGAMTTGQAADHCQLFAKELRQNNSGDLPIAAMGALRIWMSVLSEPASGLVGHLLERIDGVAGKDEPSKMVLMVEYVNNWRGNDSSANASSGATAHDDEPQKI